MKKVISNLSIVLALTTLVACSSPSTGSSTSSTASESVETSDTQTAQAQFLITADGNTTEKEVAFEVGDSVMDVLENNFTIEEEDGMVTVIDGVSQDPSKNTYWMYTVNEQMAEVGAESYELKANDKVEFYLETFN
ncbi:DUF4430 domain-containing protein [Streptococcus moroccensis]|uniref:ABC-type phosphate transport system substrate-binding protein n=1 Tax=Streptococcus moroccensis TaxID=1451356 RepID=A0ABT9YS44_9STRE|nr:DUF4430 domain-containing protein [Streptococcus moroccensis]MDQ0222544.1 ABC-type phosphate transport system substrate-binding protein [Streptococcus moroccensis]